MREYQGVNCRCVIKLKETKIKKLKLDCYNHHILDGVVNRLKEFGYKITNDQQQSKTRKFLYIKNKKVGIGLLEKSFNNSKYFEISLEDLDNYIKPELADPKEKIMEYIEATCCFGYKKGSIKQLVEKILDYVDSKNEIEETLKKSCSNCFFENVPYQDCDICNKNYSEWKLKL